MMALSGVAAMLWVQRLVVEEKLKSTVMMGSALGWLPQLGSLIVAKESWLSVHHSDLWKPM